MLSVISPEYARELVGADWRADENFLTAEFFGLVRYAPPNVMAAILRSAIPFDPCMPLRLPDGCDSACWEISHWPKEDEGEPDGRIRWLDDHGRTRLDLVLEVKLRSGPSDVKGERPQLLRYADTAKRWSEDCGPGRAAPVTGLIYLTLDRPDAATRQHLAEAVANDVTVLLLSWRDVAEVIFGLKTATHDPASRVLLDDLYSVLRSRGIMASSDIPKIKLGGNAMRDIRAAHALVRRYYEQIVEIVRSVDATCEGRGLGFKEWTTLDFALPKKNQRPQAMMSSTLLPLTYGFFWWQTETSTAVPQGATWVVLEHCADASLTDVQDQAPGEEGSYIAVFVARPEPGFSEAKFDAMFWRELLADQFGCGEPLRGHLFNKSRAGDIVEPRVHRHGGEMHACRVDIEKLTSGEEFAKAVLQPLRKAVDDVMKRGG